MELILIIVGGTFRDPLRCWPGALCRVGPITLNHVIRLSGCRTASASFSHSAVTSR